jgi:flotillin
MLVALFNPLPWIAGVLLLLVIGALAFWGLVTAFYVKTPPNMAFIRTGWGGRKVVIDGGALVIFRIHEIRWVPLETLKLEIFKANKEAAITKDRFRVDLGTEFYVRVRPDEANVERAARSFGDRLLNPDEVRKMLEEKLVAAIRAVVAGRTLVELHEDRLGLAAAIADSVRDLLADHGLVLESVSVYHLDQTRKDVLDPNNVFDAVALKQIAAVTAREARERNEIERTTEVAITRKNVEAHKEKLELELEKETASHLQKKNIETDRIAREAETEQFRIATEETVRRRDILREQQIREAEIQREIYLVKQREELEKAQIEREMEVQAERVRRQQAVQVADVEREEAVEIARRVARIRILEKEQERLRAEAEQLEADIQRERVAQELQTVAEQLKAEREKLLALIAASREVEVAEQQARARERLAAALEREGEAEATARRARLEAENVRDVKLLTYEVARVLAERAPEIVRELMEPARHIESIRILDMPQPVAGDGAANGSPEGPWSRIASHVVTAGMVLPVLKELLGFAKVGSSEFVRGLATQFPGLQRLLEGEKEEESGKAAAESTPKGPREALGAKA